MRRARPPLGRVRGEFLLFYLGIEARCAGDALQQRAQEIAPNARAAHLRLHRVEQQEQALGLRRAQQERIGGRKPLALAEHALHRALRNQGAHLAQGRIRNGRKVPRDAAVDRRERARLKAQTFSFPRVTPRGRRRGCR